MITTPTTADGTSTADVCIVGAGPVGLFGAYYAGVRGLKVAVVDSLPEPGGQITAMYPEKAIFDVAGFPAIRGRELVQNLVAQAAPFAPNYLLGRQAIGLERGEGFVLTLADGHRLHAKAIIVTDGIGTFTPRPLPAGEDKLGRGVVHFVPDPSEYADRDVVVVGGGDSALGLGVTAAPDCSFGRDHPPQGRIPCSPALGGSASRDLGAHDHRRSDRCGTW